MNSHQNQQLASLKDKLLAMASRVETAITKAIRALVERDDELATSVKIEDDDIDELEIEIDDMAVALLAKAPLARDLRFIIAAMKICQNLERAGDEAAGVAKQAIRLNREEQLKPYVDIPRMADMALDMLHKSLDAFVNGNSALAREVLPMDLEVDSLHKQLQRELISYMLEKPSTITRCLALLQLAKRLERIADHATNVAEEVVYLHEGRDIRHGHGESSN
jgi:phosphate transport system protein